MASKRGDVKLVLAREFWEFLLGRLATVLGWATMFFWSTSTRPAERLVTD
jgi:hypothetical protein